MAQLTIEVNGRPYLVGCEDGQEDHLLQLAAQFDGQVRLLTDKVGHLGETRLLVMGALMMADELAEAKSRLAQAQAEAARLRMELSGVESRAAAALDAAARRIETLAGQGQGNGLLL